MTTCMEDEVLMIALIDGGTAGTELGPQES